MLMDFLFTEMTDISTNTFEKYPQDEIKFDKKNQIKLVTLDIEVSSGKDSLMWSRVKRELIITIQDYTTKEIIMGCKTI